MKLHLRVWKSRSSLSESRRGLTTLKSGCIPLAVRQNDPLVAAAFEVERFFGQGDGQQREGEQSGQKQAAHRESFYFCISKVNEYKFCVTKGVW